MIVHKVLLNALKKSIAGSWYREEWFHFVWYLSYIVHDAAVLNGWPLSSVIVLRTPKSVNDVDFDEVWDS